MNTSRILFSILAILLGVFIFVYGGYDDSPGAQGLGLLVVILGIIGVIKSKNILTRLNSKKTMTHSREDNPFEETTVAQEWIDAIESEKGGAREKEVYPMIRNWVKENKLETVLEVGSGQGVCSPYIEAKYIGVEPSPILIDRAKQIYSKENRTFIKGSAYDLPLEKDSADGAFSVGVWFHLENLDDAHAELARVLNKNGKVLIITSNPETHLEWEALFSGTKEGKKLDGGVKLPTGYLTRNVFFLHTKEELIGSLERNGFEVTGTKNFGFGSENVEDKGLGFWIAIQATKKYEN